MQACYTFPNSKKKEFTGIQKKENKNLNPHAEQM